MEEAERAAQAKLRAWVEAETAAAARTQLEEAAAAKAKAEREAQLIAAKQAERAHWEAEAAKAAEILAEATRKAGEAEAAEAAAAAEAEAGRVWRREEAMERLEQAAEAQAAEAAEAARTARVVADARRAAEAAEAAQMARVNRATVAAQNLAKEKAAEAVRASREAREAEEAALAAAAAAGRRVARVRSTQSPPRPYSSSGSSPQLPYHDPYGRDNSHALSVYGVDAEAAKLAQQWSDAAMIEAEAHVKRSGSARPERPPSSIGGRHVAFDLSPEPYTAAAAYARPPSPRTGGSILRTPPPVPPVQPSPSRRSSFGASARPSPLSVGPVSSPASYSAGLFSKSAGGAGPGRPSPSPGKPPPSPGPPQQLSIQKGGTAVGAAARPRSPRGSSLGFVEPPPVQVPTSPYEREIRMKGGRSPHLHPDRRPIY